MKTIIFEFVKSRGVLDLMQSQRIINDRIGHMYNCIFDDTGILYGFTDNIINVTMKGDDWKKPEINDVFKELNNISDEYLKIKFINTNEKYGIEMINCFSEFYTDDLKAMLKRKNSVIKKMEMTSIECPEQYDCFDEFGHMIAYFRLRHGYFSVEYPDVNGYIVYETEYIDGDGMFTNDNERVSELENGIDAVDKFYEKSINVSREIAISNFSYKLKEGVEIEEALRELYYYQKSMFYPDEVIRIRRKGTVIGYRDAIKKVLCDHRLIRHNMFPEANGSNGLNDEHIEHELEFFKTTINGLGGHMKTINWLFDKSFEDFEKIFREYSKKGSNSI